MPRKTLHGVFKSKLGISGSKKHIDLFLEEEFKGDRMSFISIRDRILNVKRKIDEEGFTYKNFYESTKVKPRVAMGGLHTWVYHADAGLARIVEKALANKPLSTSDINVFKKHINQAIKELERANQEYKNLQAFVKPDYPYAVGIIETLSLIKEKPEVYANLIYIYAKHGKVIPSYIEENLDKLFSPKKTKNKKQKKRTKR